MSDTPYDDLSPDLILDALESAGFEPSGGLLALNSFENRVYQIELNDGGVTRMPSDLDVFALYGALLNA